jgi:hypothetical protein
MSVSSNIDLAGSTTSARSAVSRGVGHELVDDADEVETRERVVDRRGVRVLRHRVGALDERRGDRRVLGGEHAAPQLAHGTELADTRRRRQLEGIGARDVGRLVEVVEAAPGHADVPGDRLQRGDRAHGLAAVAVALEAEADVDVGRPCLGEALGERHDRLGRDVARPLRLLRRVLAHEPAVVLEAVGVVGDELLVDQALLEEDERDGVGQEAVGARPRRQVLVARLRRLRAHRVDADEARALRARLLEKRELVRVRDGGVLPPQHDHLRVDVVLRRVVHERAEGEPRRLQAGRVAQVAVHRGVAAEVGEKQPPELRHHAVVAGALVVQDRARIALAHRRGQRLGDAVQRVVPGDLLELGRPALPLAHPGPEQALLAVDALHVALRERRQQTAPDAVVGVGLHLDEAAVLDVREDEVGRVAGAGGDRPDHGHGWRA